MLDTEHPTLFDLYSFFIHLPIFYHEYYPKQILLGIFYKILEIFQ
ncbi:hypothetical protein HMPREF9380_0390 [Streptococcus sanguinis SK49]|uniref:Uncharacterized protein n=1 Tax=Streptococcus sanguinis SK49 TaxID=888808 RepID=F3UV47_STRSA|nr:hypothetical protein HMPREF9380_0390 [Streptococcus sanguinis SK49]